ASMDSHRRHHSGVFLVRCVSRRSTAPADRRRLVPHKRAAGEDVYLSALQRQQLGHHRALGRLRRAGDQLRTQHNQASRRGLAGELWLLGCWPTWLEDDEIRVGKNGWTLEAKIKNVRRVGDPTRYCLINEC